MHKSSMIFETRAGSRLQTLPQMVYAMIQVNLMFLGTQTKSASLGGKALTIIPPCTWSSMRETLMVESLSDHVSKAALMAPDTFLTFETTSSSL